LQQKPISYLSQQTMHLENPIGVYSGSATIKHRYKGAIQKKSKLQYTTVVTIN